MAWWGRNLRRAQCLCKSELHFYDLGGLNIADDVMFGPNVSIITARISLLPNKRHQAISNRLTVILIAT
jgi:acetyltransferase-like isoleucine patch superfamily enzyme